VVSSQCAGQHLRPRFRPRCRGLHEPAEEAELALALAQAEEELAQAEKELAAESACELVLGSDHSAGAAAGSQALADAKAELRRLELHRVLDDSDDCG